jgi:hypothetical protein
MEKKSSARKNLFPNSFFKVLPLFMNFTLKRKLDKPDKINQLNNQIIDKISKNIIKISKKIFFLSF